MIRTCKRYITQSGRKTIWNQDRLEVEEKLLQCIKLNQGYKDAYARVKNRKVGKEIREFSFSEKYIFGRFDSFCMRLRCEIPNMMESSIFCRNLLKMFSTINQFTSLFNSRTEVCDRKIADEIQFCRNRLCKFSAVPI